MIRPINNDANRSQKGNVTLSGIASLLLIVGMAFTAYKYLDVIHEQAGTAEIVGLSTKAYVVARDIKDIQSRIDMYTNRIINGDARDGDHERRQDLINERDLEQIELDSLEAEKAILQAAQ